MLYKCASWLTVVSSLETDSNETFSRPFITTTIVGHHNRYIDGVSMFWNIAAVAISPPLSSKRQNRKPTIPRTQSGTLFSKFLKRRTISITQMGISNQGAGPPLMAAPSTHKEASDEFKSASRPLTRKWFVFVHTQNRGFSNYILSSSVSRREQHSQTHGI